MEYVDTNTHKQLSGRKMNPKWKNSLEKLFKTIISCRKLFTFVKNDVNRQKIKQKFKNDESVKHNFETKF